MWPPLNDEPTDALARMLMRVFWKEPQANNWPDWPPFIFEFLVPRYSYLSGYVLRAFATATRGNTCKCATAFTLSRRLACCSLASSNMHVADAS